MAALHSRCGHYIFVLLLSSSWRPCNMARHYIFALWFLSSSFFLLLLFFLAQSQRPHIGCLPYFHTCCGPTANLECTSEMCCTWLAGNTGRKKSPFWHHHKFVGLYLRNLLNSNTSSTCRDNMVNFGLLTAEICWRVWSLGHPCTALFAVAHMTNDVAHQRPDSLHSTAAGDYL